MRIEIIDEEQEFGGYKPCKTVWLLCGLCSVARTRQQEAAQFANSLSDLCA